MPKHLPAEPERIEPAKVSGFVLLPPAGDVCDECAADHPPELPHDAHSLYYQLAFFARRGVAPTWHDAMAHCTDEVKQYWIEAMAEQGFVLDENGNVAQQVPIEITTEEP